MTLYYILLDQRIYTEQQKFKSSIDGIGSTVRPSVAILISTIDDKSEKELMSKMLELFKERHQIYQKSENNKLEK